MYVVHLYEESNKVMSADTANGNRLPSCMQYNLAICMLK